MIKRALDRPGDVEWTLNEREKHYESDDEHFTEQCMQWRRARIPFRLLLAIGDNKFSQNVTQQR